MRNLLSGQMADMQPTKPTISGSPSFQNCFNEGDRDCSPMRCNALSAAGVLVVASLSRGGKRLKIGKYAFYWQVAQHFLVLT